MFIFYIFLRSSSVLDYFTNLYFLIYIGEFVKEYVGGWVFYSSLRSNNLTIVISTSVGIAVYCLVILVSSCIFF